MTALKLPLVLVVASIFIVCHQNFVVASDGVAPISSVTFDPTTPDGLEGWYLQTVNAKITASDLESGVYRIGHSLNESPWEYKIFNSTLNFITNPSFEDSLEGTWQLVGDALGGVDSTVYFSGTRSVNIVSTSVLSETCWENAVRYAPAKPWDTINASAYIKTSSVAGLGAYFKIYAINNGIKSQVGESTKVVGSTNWQILAKSTVLGVDVLDGVYLSLCLLGTGTVNFDSVYTASTAEEISDSFFITQNGINTINYNAQDNALNVEVTKNATIKIDTKSPTDWDNFTIGNDKGNNHTFSVSIDVSDMESGLKKGYEKFQYSVDAGWHWGYFTNLDKCSGNFVNGGWVSLNDISTDGQNTVTLNTPVVNYCNSVWRICKNVRFFVRDVAGRDSIRDICINGPWFRTKNASIYATGSIAQGGGEGDTATGLIHAGATVSNVTSELGIEIENYEHKVLPLSYADLLSKTKNVVTTSSFPRSSGAYRINSDLTIGRTTVSTEVKNGSAKVVVFVNGDLTIDYNVDIADGGAVVFVVAGDVDIARSVEIVDLFLLSSGKTDTTYNGNLITDSLVINGGVVSGTVDLSRQVLFNQATEPAEDIVWNPNHLLYLSEILGTRKVVYKEL